MPDGEVDYFNDELARPGVAGLTTAAPRRGRQTVTMSDTPAGSSATGADTIVGISFDDSFRAQEFLTATYRLVATHSVELLDAVTIAKTVDGRTHVRETIDPQAATSALSGGLWASLFGLILAGPVGWLAGAVVGASAGVIRAKVVDLGLPDEWVKWFRDAVRPGTVTVVLLLGRLDQTLVLDELERFSGARLVYANVTSDFGSASATPSTTRRPVRSRWMSRWTRGRSTANRPRRSIAGDPLPPPDPGSRVD